MATRDLTRRFAELRVLQHGVEGVSENKRPGDAFSESGLLDVRKRAVCFTQLSYSHDTLWKERGRAAPLGLRWFAICYDMICVTMSAVFCLSEYSAAVPPPQQCCEGWNTTTELPCAKVGRMSRCSAISKTTWDAGITRALVPLLCCIQPRQET